MIGDHQLIGMRHIKIRAEQFAHQIGVSMAGIKQIDPVLDPVTLDRQVCQLFFALIKQPRILAPRQHAARPDQGDRAQHQQRNERERLRPACARHFKGRITTFHAVSQNHTYPADSRQNAQVAALPHTQAQFCLKIHDKLGIVTDIEAMLTAWSRLVLGVITACAAQPALAQSIFDRATVSGVVLAGPVVASENRSWTGGGLGKLEHNGSSFDADAVIAWRPDISGGIAVHVSADAQASVRGLVGLDEAYLRLRRDPGALIGVSARAGLFFPLASLEHDGAEWTTHYTLTPSAIGSWIAEEVKVLGAEATLHTFVAERRVSLTIAAFGANDTAGALLAFRGWALHDIRATAGQTLPLPPVPAIFTAIQASRTQPVAEVDGRIGGYAKAEIVLTNTFDISGFVYANNGNRVSNHNGQYSWMTRFITVGAKWRSGNNPGRNSTTVLAQVIVGETQMGDLIGGQIPVNVGFRAAYLLVSRPLNWGQLTARIDAFEVHDRTQLNIGERGAAITGNWTKRLSARTELVAETVAAWSNRPARAALGERAKQTNLQARLAIRARF